MGNPNSLVKLSSVESNHPNSGTPPNLSQCLLAQTVLASNKQFQKMFLSHDKLSFDQKHIATQVSKKHKQYTVTRKGSCYKRRRKKQKKHGPHNSSNHAISHLKSLSSARMSKESVVNGEAYKKYIKPTLQVSGSDGIQSRWFRVFLWLSMEVACCDLCKLVVEWQTKGNGWALVCSVASWWPSTNRNGLVCIVL